MQLESVGAGNTAGRGWLQWRETQGRHISWETGDNRTIRIPLSHICLYAILLALSRDITQSRFIRAPLHNPLDSEQRLQTFIFEAAAFRKKEFLSTGSKLFPPLFFSSQGEERRYWIGRKRGLGYDLCLNLFTENKTHQIWSGGPKRPPLSLDATYHNFIRFYIWPGQR